MKGWNTKKLGDVATVFDGPHATPSTVDSGPIFLGISALQNGIINLGETRHVTQEDFERWTRRVKPQANDVVFSYETRLGQAAIIPEGLECCLGRRMGLVRFREGTLIPRFFLYQYLSPLFGEFLASRTIRGATVDRISIKEFPSFPIAVPPLAEQEWIVGILDEAFEGIATAKANAEKNLRNARALFERHLQSVFVECGEGWVEKKIGDVCTLKSGTTVDPALERATGDVPYLKVADMNYAGNETEVVTSTRFLNRIDIREKTVLPPGTTIFPKRGGAILTNKKRLTAVPICTDLNIMGVTPGSELLPKYLYFFFVNVDMRRIGSGSSIPQINNYDIEPLILRFPQSAGEQADVVRKLEELAGETRRLELLYQRKIAALERLKKSLLHEAFTGNL